MISKELESELNSFKEIDWLNDKLSTLYEDWLLKFYDDEFHNKHEWFKLVEGMVHYDEFMILIKKAL